MKNFNKILIFLVSLVVFLGAPSFALAATSWCECYSNITGQDPKVLFKNQSNIVNASCIAAVNADCNVTTQASFFKSGSINPVCKAISDVPMQGDVTGMGVDKVRCDWYVAAWNTEKTNLLATGSNTSQDVPTQSSGGTSVISTLITECGQPTISAGSPCRDVTIFIKLALQIVNYLFALIGALALCVFIYGGFVLIFSAGSEERVKQGTGAMVNAVIGILVTFSGYVLVSFLGDLLNLKTGFTLFF